MVFYDVPKFHYATSPIVREKNQKAVGSIVCFLWREKVSRIHIFHQSSAILAKTYGTGATHLQKLGSFSCMQEQAEKTQFQRAKSIVTTV